MNLGDLGPLAVAFVFVTIVLGIGATILGTVQADQVTGAAGCNATVKTGCGYDYNASNQGLSSVDTLSTWLPTIAIVVAASVVIGALAFFRS